MIGHDLDRDKVLTFRVSRIRGDIRLASRRERDFRLPEDFDADEYRLPPNWQVGESQGEARIEVGGDTAWWVERIYGRHGKLEGGAFVTPYSSLALLASWILRQEGRAVPVSPPALRREVQDGLKLVQERHEGDPPKVAAEAAVPSTEGADERPASPVPAERFGLLQALLAYLLDACGEEGSAVIPAADLLERFNLPEESLDEHLQLLNLVNFGGGCYAVYTELHGDQIHVDKELFGDTFRSPPRLTPLEARAIRLALEFVGPMIAADAHTPLDRVRRKLEETFGQVDLSQTAEPQLDRARKGSSARSPRAFASAGSSRSSTRRKKRKRSRSGPWNPTSSSGACRTGTSTHGIAGRTRSVRSVSTECAALGCSEKVRASARVRDQGAHRAGRTDLVLAEDRALEGRGGSEAAEGRRRAERAGGRKRGVADRRDPVRPRRVRPPGAGGPA